MKTIIGIVLVLIIMGATNPTYADYRDYEQSQLKASSSGPIESGLVSLFGSAILSVTTTERNDKIFTIFTTDNGTTKENTLGICGMFIPIGNKQN